MIHTVRVPGRGEYFVRDSGGDGPAVLLVHAGVADARMWQRQVGELAQDPFDQRPLVLVRSFREADSISSFTTA